ncbi:hypothetical protein [Paenibacillus sp. NAIST15-1]|uniref:hypothetical protein n=1 Tax=Paenibacillus sp. NAIST15-1 TaxID=1605994 RepID=UPI00086DCF28|nr:hypothetical protein [Paenibacillus sp. NAIST15-1]GAV11374.1 putative fibronectin type III domain protein [Paenibacillus sp. NAIST15-1]
MELLLEEDKQFYGLFEKYLKGKSGRIEIALGIDYTIDINNYVALVVEDWYEDKIPMLSDLRSKNCYNTDEIFSIWHKFTKIVCCDEETNKSNKDDEDDHLSDNFAFSLIYDEGEEYMVSFYYE